MADEGRRRLLVRLEILLETPLVALGVAWLILTIIELAGGDRPLLTKIMNAIWAVFILDFAVKIFLAPRKLRFAAKNWLTVLSLAVPALRVFRLARAMRLLRLNRAFRGVRLVRLVGSMNRGMGALDATLERRGFGYVVLLTAIVTAGGAGGMLAFERPLLQSYSEALWWTAMMMTTMGTGVWPKSAEGRILCFLLALYAFAVFGYITATLASYFIGADARASGRRDPGKADGAPDRSI